MRGSKFLQNIRAFASMNICLICNEYPPAKHGGIGSYTRDLARSLVSRGHRVTVIGVYPKEETWDKLPSDTILEGVRVIRLVSQSQLGSRAAAFWDRYALKRRLSLENQRAQFDIVEAPDYQGWIAYGGPRNTPLVVRFHGSALYFDSELQRHTSSLIKYFERRTIRNANYIISVSDYTAVKTLGLCGLSSVRYEVIYNAVDSARFSPDTSVATESGLVVYVGSITPKKGVESLVKAMNIVCSRLQRARLVLIGKHDKRLPSGLTYVDHIKSMISPEISERVCFMGPMDRETEVLHFLRKAEVCCYPSHSEAFAIAPLEAMSVGKAVVYTKAASGTEAIRDEVTGLLCDPHNPEDIAEKILRVLESGDFARELGNRARQSVLERFDLEAWVKDNVTFYQRCIADFGSA